MKQTKQKPIPLYTKTGDSGTSQLANGKRLPKNHPIFNCLGNLDELNASLGLCKLHTFKGFPFKGVQKELETIQHDILTVGAIIAGSKKVKLNQSSITKLEKRIDFYQQNTAKDWYQNFLLPGGSLPAAHLDSARTICRRTERSLVNLKKNYEVLPSTLYHLPLTYLNRLSDYLFALRCYSNATHHIKEKKFKNSS